MVQLDCVRRECYPTFKSEKFFVWKFTVHTILIKILSEIFFFQKPEQNILQLILILNINHDVIYDLPQPHKNYISS